MMGVVRFPTTKSAIVSCSWCTQSFAGLGLRRQAVALAEIQQDVGGLADDDVAGFQERRRKRRVRGFRRRVSRIIAAMPSPRARDVDVVGAGIFQRQAHEFAASLDRSGQ